MNNSQTVSQNDLKDIVYLNYAATSFPKNPEVVRIYNEALASLPEGSRHGSGEDTLIEKARYILAERLNVEVRNVYFSTGATQGLNEVILGTLYPGDHCLYDNRCHTSVVRPLMALPKTINAEMCSLHCPDETQDIKALLSKLQPSTKLVCLVHASNVTGSIYDIGTVIDALRAEAPNVVILVDAAQSAGVIPLHDALKADYIVFQGHKHLHAPHGAAVIVAKRPLKPIIFGGGQHLKGDKTDPYLLEVGTQNRAAIYATACAYDYAIEKLDEHKKHEARLLKKLSKSLEDTYGLEPLETNPLLEKASILAFRTTAGTPEADWVPYLRSQKIVVRGGLHCSPCLHEQLGLTKIGTLRLSLGWYTSDEEIDIVVQAIREFSSYLRKVA